MPQAPTFPGIYVQESPGGPRTVPGVATSIALFIGWAGKGPVDEALPIQSFGDFEREYGGLDSRTFLGHSVLHFFDNGGSNAYVFRLAETGANGVATAAASAAGFTFEASSPGEWAHAYSVRCLPEDGTTDRFRIEVLLGGAMVESFDKLSLDRTDTRYVFDLINPGSRLLRVTSAPDAVPAAVDSAPFTNGNDGAVLDPAQDDVAAIIPSLFDEGGPIDRIDLFNIVCVPGMTQATEVSRLAEKCARRRAFLIVDAAESATRNNVKQALAGMIGSGAANTGFYFPWVLAADPAAGGVIKPCPPCGFVAGIYARTDAQRGVWKAPAGTAAAINDARGLVESLGTADIETLNASAINCLRTTSHGHFVWGARTLDGGKDRGSEWRYIPVRRLALFIEESLFRGTLWAVFEPNDETLWSQLRLTTSAFLQNLFRQGAFQGASAREAYFVRCDRTTTSPADIQRGIVNIEVGFAPLRPAEFIVLRIRQTAADPSS